MLLLFAFCFRGWRNILSRGFPCFRCARLSQIHACLISEVCGIKQTSSLSGKQRRRQPREPRICFSYFSISKHHNITLKSNCTLERRLLWSILIYGHVYFVLLSEIGHRGTFSVGIIRLIDGITRLTNGINRLIDDIVRLLSSLFG